ncbi:MAG: pitrilysin family protein [Rhodanobacteraceae bacterium]
MRVRHVVMLICMAFATPVLAQSLAIPPLKFHQRTLDNGLEVLSLVDHSSPTVTVQVWYHVGSKDDPQGRSGFAHLFEHLMFKSTEHMPAEEMDKLTEAVGGMNNASTGDDVTNYFEVVPSNHLKTLLWAEAERMSNLTVDDKNFKSERAVVEEEYRQRVQAPPYGKLFNAIDKYSFRVHPYKRPTIGSIPELEAASLADVRAFHKTFYRPDNATLIVVGDFDPAQMNAWVDDYFGWIGHPDSSIPQVTATEPARSKDRSVTLTSANAPLPAMAMTWLIPPAKSPDSIALEVAAQLLAGGHSSRLYQSLVYQDQIAQSVGVFADTRVGPGLFTAYAILASGHQPGEARKAIMAGISRLASKPIDIDELAKVKMQMLTGQLKQRQTPIGKAFALGQAALYEGDPARANTDLVALQKVSAADVQRVLKKYVTDAHSVTIDYLPEHKTTGKTTKEASK